MELFQVFWDDQKNLFLQFKKNEEENLKILPETVKRVNIRFEIFKQDLFDKTAPSLICIRKIYFFKDFIIFSIDLNEIFELDGLVIEILNLTIFLSTNKRFEISIYEKFELSEIYIDHDFCLEYIYEKSESNKISESSLTKEKIYHERETDYKNNKEKSRFIYEKNCIKKSSQNDIIMATIRENNKRLKNIEDQLKVFNITLKNISFNNFNYSSHASQMRGPPRRAIERIKKVNGAESQLSIKPPVDLYFLPELKALVKDTEKFKNFLKPMSDEELNEIILNEDNLKNKQIEFFNRQKEKIKIKKPETISLENLKKPK